MVFRCSIISNVVWLLPILVKQYWSIDNENRLARNEDPCLTSDIAEVSYFIKENAYKKSFPPGRLVRNIFL